MAAPLTPEAQAFLREPNYAVVATVGPRGTPQQTVVWIDTDGENVLFNTLDGRAKARNLRRDPRVSVFVFDQGDAYRWVAIQGRVKEITTQGAVEHIHQLSRKYEGRDFGALRAEHVRLKVVIEPRNVVTRGLGG